MQTTAAMGSTLQFVASAAEDHQLTPMLSLQVDGSKGLPAQASMRGAYMNTGSRDVGPDKAL